MKFQGPHFIEYAAAAAHAAKVPIALHLDHCTEATDVETALELPFDSIMVDASRLEPDENIAECARIVKKAVAKGIAIEAEMGRIDGNEDGLAHADIEAMLTDPSYVKNFVEKTGVHFIAPAFGNIHGNYGAGGAEKAWRLPLWVDLFIEIDDKTTDCYLAA
jgi:fructose-bisphosphate aldolase class II